ncbi:very short patch repair endonuclease [Brevibacillus humidisoli]|uniref:very short patch repair endonuclease n=1 Tax=Brevibacillus humidisoli TaxID=2895522 RepID=UPI001E4E60D9|nr:very short patch repair endonuclease [Brevibacillus humidisoli]UFJ40403.1 very short patch repair endonuclease [Brevibacillus humidisoli]
MADVYDKETRSSVMQRVRSKGNKSTELRLINLFTEYGITGWRRNYPVKGHPDFVFLKKRVAIFVDGCFWHGHNCRNTRPKENADYWDKKRERNILHDKKITDRFEARGWTVVRIWECELKKKNLHETMSRLLRFLEL